MNMTANRNSDNVAIWSHISRSLLHSWITEKNQQRKLLIIDSRSISDFNSLHINNAINIPYSKIIRRKLLNDKISIIELLMKTSQTSTYVIEELNIVVYDKQTEHSNQLVETIECDSQFALILLSKLAQKFKSVSFLQGGFVGFRENYSDLCSCSINPHPATSSNHFQMTVTPVSPPGNTDLPMCLTASNNNIQKNLSPNTSSGIEEATNPLVMQFKQKKHVFNHSISSYDFFRNQQQQNLKQQDHMPALSSHISVNDEDDLLMVGSGSPLIQATPGSTTPTLREPTKILSYLYLGSQDDALSEATLKALGITNVLNVSINCPKPDFIPDANFLRISVNDGHVAKIRPFFDVAFRFIDKCRKANTKVLIHCLAGISRSPTLAIAYLMRDMSLRSDDAYKFVKDRRPSISPNFNFLGQLYEYDRTLQLEQKATESNSVDTVLPSTTKHHPIDNMTSLNGVKSGPSNTDETSLTSTTNDSINRDYQNDENSGPTFLKFIKKNTKSPCSTPLTNCHQLDPSTNTNSHNANTSATANNNSHVLLETPAKPVGLTNQAVRGRKQFVFPFSSMPPHQQPLNDENVCTTPSPTTNNSQLLSIAKSPQTAALPSPSQAFSKFNLNSPTVSKSIVSLSSVSSSTINYNKNTSDILDTQQQQRLPKSFSVNFASNQSESSPKQGLLKNQRPSELVIRRPTNLHMSLVSSTTTTTTSTDSSKSSTTSQQQHPIESKRLGNTLKRPSSILFEQVASQSPVSDLNSTTHIVNNNPANKQLNHHTEAAPATKTSIEQNGHRQEPQLGSSSTNCSCSPNSRSSSSLSLTSSSVVSMSSPQQQQQTGPISMVCTNCVNQSLATSHNNHSTASQQQTAPQFNKKKIKLSPVQDRCVLGTFQMSQ